MMSLAPAFFDRPIAHRGLHDARFGPPENSTEAGLLALEKGFGIEIDVQLSADGQAVVFHDDTLDRMTSETGPVRGRTAAELTRIPLKCGDGAACRIPALADFLARIGGRTPVLIELKDQSGDLGPTDGALEVAVARILDKAVDPSAHAVMSFNPTMVAKMAELSPDVARGLVTDPFIPEVWPDVPETRRQRYRAIEDFRGTGACFISHNLLDLGSKAVAEVKAAGAKVLCWTVRSPAAAAKALRIADNITFEGFDPNEITG